jgi:hypothetical protein
MVLTTAWERVCLLATHTADMVYGPRTPDLRRCLTDVTRWPVRSSMPCSSRDWTSTRTQWARAKAEAVDAASGPEQHLNAACHLFWDCASVAELAAGEHPTDLAAGRCPVGCRRDRRLVRPAPVEHDRDPHSSVGLGQVDLTHRRRVAARPTQCRDRSPEQSP